jgi:hypothetical protein
MPLGKFAVLAIVVTKKPRETYYCKYFSYDLDAPSCRVFLHLCQGMRECRIRKAPLLIFVSYLDFTRPIAPRYAGDKCVRRLPKMRGAIPSQCSMMWATISKATIPRVARDAANTKSVRRFSSMVILARWKPTLASILSLRACQRV